MSTVFSELAPAKINLFLHVTGRRDDGYHLLDSLVVFADVADRITVEAAETVSLAIEGPFAGMLAGDAAGNLVLRAAAALSARAGTGSGARITLEKNLPVASGIGGGSADAAATLRALGRLWDLPQAADPAIALGLGADVPVCLECRPAIMRGIGEVLLPAPVLPAFHLVLANPGVAVSTAEVFRASRAAGFQRQAAALPMVLPDVQALGDCLAALGNDLQRAAVGIAPVIGEAIGLLAHSDGCLLARMSGSGATCFGLFADVDAARAASRAAAMRGWWTWHGTMFGTDAAGT